MTLSFALCDLGNMFIYASDCLDIVCNLYSDQIDQTREEMRADKSICNVHAPSPNCYQPVAPFLTVIYALPALFFVLVAKPHDCFYCLSMRPENRISNYQYPIDEQERRVELEGSRRETGGAFHGFIFDYKRSD